MRSFLPALFAVLAAAVGFYAHRDGASPSATAVSQSATVAQSKPQADENDRARTLEALRVLRTAPAHGLAAGKYGEARLQAAVDQLSSSPNPNATERARQLSDLHAETNRALTAFAHDVALGRQSPTAVDPNWRARRELPEAARSLDQVPTGHLEEWISRIQPQHPEYAALRRALAQLRDQERAGGWPAVPLRPLKPGVSDPGVTLLRERLAASGELAANDGATSTAYDSELEAAVKTFQEHHTITPTGVADRATLAAINVPLNDRIRQIEINLERWRWLPEDFGDRHFVVNIPGYLLMAREHGRTVRAIRVIVGKPGHETPVFSGEMATVVFSPYWNVPDSIAEDETAPAVREDPGYLARNQMEVLRRSKSGTHVVDPADVNWYDPDELKHIAFRQKPGSKNALGHVKFLFPNAFNVYLHDTPSDSLFLRSGRAFSHGCIRVEEPEALAAYVLRDRSEWTAEHISSAMNAGVEKYVQLDETIPVHIVYFTTWTDENGLFFLPDVYGYDARQTRLAR